MKKLVVAAMAVMTAFTTVSAQDLGWSFGPKIGSNGAMFIGSENSHARPGFLIGGFAENRLSKRFGVGAELVYSQQGDKAELAGGNDTYKCDYINLPILASLYLSKGFAIKAGIQPGFLVSSKVSGNNQTLDLKDQTEKFDLSIPVGIAYNFDFGLVLDLRYNIGVTKVNKLHDNTTKDIKNGVLQLSFGWAF